MYNILLIIDMQNDFVCGSLKNPSAKKIVKNIENKARNFKGVIYFTKDTHNASNYLKTQEGHYLPIKHCLKNSDGWEIVKPLQKFVKKNNIIEKPSFGSKELGQLFNTLNKKHKISSITLVGTCTDICVISNAVILKTFLPETPIIVDAKCCAGTTTKNHNLALKAMSNLQIKVI